MVCSEMDVRMGRLYKLGVHMYDFGIETHCILKNKTRAVS